MIIKHPCIIDFYGGNSFPDLSLYDPILGFLKASEGDFVDSQFVTRVRLIREAGIRVGCYHFHRKSVSTQTQINIFVNICKQAQITKNDVLVLDIEEGGETETQIKNWIEGVKAHYPENLIMIYSRANILNPISISSDYFKQYPVWTAGYPNNPDLYSSPPLAYIPDQTKWGKVWCWQYADTSIGPNWVSLEFQQWIGDRHENWFGGKVKYFEGWREIQGRRFYVHVTRFNRSNVKRVYVNGLGFQGTGNYFFNTKGKPDIVINGGHADYSVIPPIPFAVVVTDGEIQKSKPTEDSIQFDKNNQPIGMQWFAHTQAHNTVGISSILLKDGNIPTTILLQNLYNRIMSVIPFVDDTYVDPRNALFWNDAEYILITIDGRNNGTQGATQLELVEFAKSLGALNGGNLDGGDSNTLIYNDNGVPVTKNNPPDDRLHAVANFVGFWINYQLGDVMNGIAQEKLGKTVTTRSQPAARTGNSVGEIPPRSQFEFVAYADDLDHPNDPNYKWVELTDGNFANYVYPPNGLRIDILREPETTPPPVDPTVTHFINVYYDGKISVDNGEPF